MSDSEIYEYLLENIPTMESEIPDLTKMWEYSSPFTSYDDYFCQKRDQEGHKELLFYRCGNKAVSEGGMCEKHMADPLTKFAGKTTVPEGGM
jgi:hypothetical protein